MRCVNLQGTLRYFSFGLHRLKSYHVRFEQEKNALFVSH